MLAWMHDHIRLHTLHSLPRGWLDTLREQCILGNIFWLKLKGAQQSKMDQSAP